MCRAAFSVVVAGGVAVVDVLVEPGHAGNFGRRASIRGLI
jgi:hypothetical protein